MNSFRTKISYNTQPAQDIPLNFITLFPKKDSIQEVLFSSLLAIAMEQIHITVIVSVYYLGVQTNAIEQIKSIVQAMQFIIRTDSPKNIYPV